MYLIPPVRNAPNLLSWYKTAGNRGWTSTETMLSNLKTLVSALLGLSTAVFGPAEDLEMRAQPKGIDVSSHQGVVNWGTVVANGVSFAYIKATEGTGKYCGALVTRSTDISRQATRTLPSPPSTLVPPRPASSVVATTLLALISPPVPLKPTTLPPTVEVGVTMVSLSQVPLTSNVRIMHVSTSSIHQLNTCHLSDR